MSYAKLFSRLVKHRASDSKHSAVTSAVSLLLYGAAIMTTAAPPAIAETEDAQAGANAVKGIIVAQPPGASSNEDYRLDAGDHVRIRFLDRLDRDELNGDYVIGESGQLRLPRLGQFEARGKTTTELEAGIRQSVGSRGEKPGYFSIDVVQYRPFYVTGFANHPGPYPFLPGYTVLHAVSLAGGIFRSPTTSVVEMMREKRTLTGSLQRLAELLARRTRLEAERDGAEGIAIPKELAQIDPVHAGELIGDQRTIMQRNRDVITREKSWLEGSIASLRKESEDYKANLQRIGLRIEEQTKLYNLVQQLRDQKIVNQQRMLETVLALDSTERDRQLAFDGLSRVNSSLLKAERDLSMVTLGENARITKELTETGEEITKVKAAVSETRQLFAGLDMMATQGDEQVTFKIGRRDSSGRMIFTPATETTPIMSGDVIQLNLKQNVASLNWSN